MEELFGDKLIKNDGDDSSPNDIGAKDLGIYFSAHWCPPCRGFTPQLVEFYNKFKTDDPGRLEIIFVSSDRDEEAFNEYFGEMPWLALPFGNREKKAELCTKFNVRGIPKLIILNRENLEKRTEDGRAQVAGWKDKGKEVQTFQWA